MNKIDKQINKQRDRWLDKQAKITCQCEPPCFQENFLVLPTMNRLFLGNVFFSENFLQLIRCKFCHSCWTWKLNWTVFFLNWVRNPKMCPKLLWFLTKKACVPPQSHALPESHFRSCLTDINHSDGLYFFVLSSRIDVILLLARHSAILLFEMLS